MFDKVIVAQGHNLDKPAPSHSIFDNLYLRTYQKALFVNIFDLIDTHKDECNLTLIRGIRNGGDLSDELTLQTFIRSQTDILCVNIFTSPELSHVSSGAIRQLDQLKVVHSLSV
jgi:phosphopantetheine adenylyltransferase